MKQRKPASSRGRRTRTNASTDELLNFARLMADQYQEEWHRELLEDKPEWTYLMGLHLRLVELEQLEPAVKEFL
jgi:hypothetical protein